MLEKIKENNLTINRFHCKEGFIDVTNCWTNPKYHKPGGQHTNISRWYYRIDKDWLEECEFKSRGFWLEIKELCSEFTAIEIWNSFKK